MEFPEKYINPLTDFGFKKLFGEEVNIDLLDENSLKYYHRSGLCPTQIGQIYTDFYATASIPF